MKSNSYDHLLYTLTHFKMLLPPHVMDTILSTKTSNSLNKHLYSDDPYIYTWQQLWPLTYIQLLISHVHLDKHFNGNMFKTETHDLLHTIDLILPPGFPVSRTSLPVLTATAVQARNLSLSTAVLLHLTQFLAHSRYWVFFGWILNTFMETAIKPDSQSFKDQWNGLCISQTQANLYCL